MTSIGVAGIGRTWPVGTAAGGEAEGPAGRIWRPNFMRGRQCWRRAARGREPASRDFREYAAGFAPTIPAPWRVRLRPAWERWSRFRVDGLNPFRPHGH